MKNAQEHYKLWDQYCWFENPKNGFSLFSKEEYEHMVYQDEVHQAEMEAENAWLRKAEQASYDDMAFEKWEWERMYT